jgi:lipopolysaccharide biosynthesis glycosyltransferase
MNIVCTIDSNYIRHCAVMLRSLRNHNPDCDLHIYIIHESLDPEERCRLVLYLDSFLTSVSLIQVDSSLLGEFPVFGHISIATYFRLLLPSVLPLLISRVLFLDSDIVIIGPLDELWNTAMNNYPVAAVTDRNLDMQRKRLGMASEAPYFNAGVMLIDLDQWRNERILERGIDFAKSNADKLDNWDQDVLNHLFENRVQLVHQRWNAMSHLWGLDPAWIKAQGGLTIEEQEAHDNPAVIHFAGGGFAKPWNYNCPHPRKADYRQVLSLTPWSTISLDGMPPSDQSGLIRRALRKAFGVIRR